MVGFSTEAMAGCAREKPGGQCLVSVILGVYNGSRFIARTLDSILTQTYSAFELIVIDDGSTDQTAEIVSEYAGRDARVRLYHQERQGVASARNHAIALSRGEFVAPCDSDDLWAPTKLARQVEVASKDESIGLVYCWTEQIDETGALTGGRRAKTATGWVFRTMLDEELIGSGSVPLMRRHYVQEILGYDTSLTNMEDHDIYLRIAERWQFGVVPEFLVQYRQVASSKSRNTERMERCYKQIYQRCRARHPEIPASVFDHHEAIHLWWLADLAFQTHAYATGLQQLWKALRLRFSLIFRVKTWRYLLFGLAAFLIGPENTRQLRQKLKQVGQLPSNVRKKFMKPCRSGVALGLAEGARE